MIRFTSIVFGQLVVALGLAAVGCAGADASSAGPAPFDTSTCSWSDDLPDGTYWQSCAHCVVTNGTLDCTCLTESGEEHHTELTLHQCVTDISNENGVLVENIEPGAVVSPSAPDSTGSCDLRSVSQSCVEYTASVSALQAQEETCVGMGGTWSENKCPAPSSDGGCCSYDGHHACGYTQHAYFDQMDPCFASDVCGCDVGH